MCQVLSVQICFILLGKRLEFTCYCSLPMKDTARCIWEAESQMGISDLPQQLRLLAGETLLPVFCLFYLFFNGEQDGQKLCNSFACPQVPHHSCSYSVPQKLCAPLGLVWKHSTCFLRYL